MIGGERKRERESEREIELTHIARERESAWIGSAWFRKVPILIF